MWSIENFDSVSIYSNDIQKYHFLFQDCNTVYPKNGDPKDQDFENFIKSCYFLLEILFLNSDITLHYTPTLYKGVQTNLSFNLMAMIP